MTSDKGWMIYSDESSYNYGAVRGVSAVRLRQDDAARLSEELASLLRASSVRELKWEKVRTARAAFAAQKALAWALDLALDGELWIEALTWEVTSATASRARRPTLTQLHSVYTALLSSVMARQSQQGEQSQRWRIVPDEQPAISWTRIQAALPHTATILPARSGPQPLIQLADIFAGLAVFSRDAYDAYERWLCVRGRGQGAHATITAEGVYGSQAYRFVLLDEFYTACVRRLPGISLQTHRGLYTWRPDAPIQFRFHTSRAGL
jgi:hypothetical protein